MILSYVSLFVALLLSAIAAWYSIAGLAAIFAAAVTPVIIMGGALELAKIVTTLWLHEYWHRSSRLMKLYLVPAVAVLMMITSMGIFGFLSKAHSDQTLISGDAQSKIAVYDEKIKTQEENIAAARRALEQMDAGVDQVLGRSTTETGAKRAMDLRRAQQRERGRIQAEIAQSQQLIAELKDARAPIAAEIRKIEAEVGPIKYIAALIYGTNTDTDLLEKAVTWVIILLVVVFDPLAIMLLLAATQSIKWHRQPVPVAETVEQASEPKYDSPIDPESEIDTSAAPESESDHLDTPAENTESTESTQDQQVLPNHPYLQKPFVHFVNLTPMVAPKESPAAQESAPTASPGIVAVPDVIRSGVRYGLDFPANQVRSSMFIKVNQVPHRLYKFTGRQWIEVDKVSNDSYTYDSNYIDFLIKQLTSNQYDAELLTDREREQIAIRLQTFK